MGMDAVSGQLAEGWFPTWLANNSGQLADGFPQRSAFDIPPGGRGTRGEAIRRVSPGRIHRRSWRGVLPGFAPRGRTDTGQGIPTAPALFPGAPTS